MAVFTYDTDICPAYANGMTPSCPGEVDSNATAASCTMRHTLLLQALLLLLLFFIVKGSALCAVVVQVPKKKMQQNYKKIALLVN